MLQSNMSETAFSLFSFKQLEIVFLNEKIISAPVILYLGSKMAAKQDFRTGYPVFSAKSAR